MRVRTAVASVASCLGLVLAVAPPAQAAYTEVLVTHNGVWKALGVYKPQFTQLCVRVYNGTSAATAEVTMSSPAFGVINITDHGGNTDPTCLSINVPSGAQFNMFVRWVSESGLVKTEGGSGVTG